jgi:hypothetical protein
MSSPVSNVSAPEPRLRVLRTLTITGVLLFLLGAALAVLLGPQVWNSILRWAGLVLIAAAGLRGRSLTYWIFLLSDIFLRLIKVIVAPLILGTLVTGIAGHGNLRSVGRIGLKSLVYFEVVTTLALFIGVGAINISRAGEGLSISVTPGVAAAQHAEPLHWEEFLLHIFPENIAKSIAENQILQVAVFALLFGIALALLPQAKREPMLKFCESLSATMFSFTNLVMYFAPVGVGAAMAYTVGHMGIGVLLPLGKLLFTGYAALIAFLLLVLLPIAVFARIPIARFLRAVSEPATIAFATSTSEARDGGDGGVRRAAEDRGFRHSCRIQLQHGRLFGLFGAGIHICGAGRGDPYVLGTAARHGFHAYVDEQRRSGSSSCNARGAASHRVRVSSTYRADFYHSGHRCADGHGTHRRKRDWKLSGLRRHRPLGRRTSSKCLILPRRIKDAPRKFSRSG